MDQVKPLVFKVIKPFVQAFNRARTPEEKEQALIRILAQQNLDRQAQEAIRKRQEEERKVRKVNGVRMRHLTRTLTLVPIVAGTISTVLFLAQGGFGGGHSRLDVVIEILGLPSILLNLVLPNSLNLPDILMIVWIPALMNAILFFLFGRVLSSLRQSRG